MGSHHFELSMLPSAYFDRRGVPRPSALTEDDIDRGESPDTGWWSSDQPSEGAVSRLRQLCPIKKDWGETEERVTSETWGSDLRIWRERDQVWSVTFRFSPCVDERSLLDRFAAIARDERCLLLDRASGELFEPADATVSERLKTSRALRFAIDPRGTLIEAAAGTQE